MEEECRLYEQISRNYSTTSGWPFEGTRQSRQSLERSNSSTPRSFGSVDTWSVWAAAMCPHASFLDCFRQQRRAMEEGSRGQHPWSTEALGIATPGGASFAKMALLKYPNGVGA